MAASRGHLDASQGLLKYLTLMAAFNAYFLSGIAQAFGARGWSLLAFLPLFVLGAVGPIYCHAIIRRGAKGVIPKICARVGYSWCGISILTFFSFAAIDVARALGLLAEYAIASGGMMAAVPAWGSAALSGTIAALLCSSALVNGGAVRRKEVVVETDKELPGEIRIAYFSDSHFSVMTSRGHARRIAKAIKSCNPDIVVACGDIIDSGKEVVGRHMKLLSGIRCRHGKYAVLGNHERAAGIDEAVDLFRESGFTVLRGECRDAGPVRVAGVDDAAILRVIGKNEPSESSFIPNDGKYTVLAKHRPIPGDGEGRVDLQISGHTHGGQIFPFTYAVRAYFQYVSGLFKTSCGRSLYVSNGAGTWGPPMRFLAPQEIVLIRVVPAGSLKKPAEKPSEAA